MNKGVQTIDKKPLLTIEDMQNYDLGLEIENNELQQQLDKYKNVIDKIKEEIEIFNSVEYNANNFTILSLITRIDELLEKVE